MTIAAPPADAPKNLRLRPFAAAHWSLLLLLVMAWLALLLGEVCAPPPYYGKVALAAATACLALWSNHAARAPLRGLKSALLVLLRSVYDLFGLALIVLLTCVPLAMTLPATQCYTDRARVGEMLLSAGPMRSEIASRALAAGTLAHSGRDLKIGRAAAGPNIAIGGGVVSEDGAIVIVGEKPVVAIMLTPALKDGKVEWTCTGFPRTIMPATCRDDARP